MRKTLLRIVAFLLLPCVGFAGTISVKNVGSGVAAVTCLYASYTCGPGVGFPDCSLGPGVITSINPGQTITYSYGAPSFQVWDRTLGDPESGHEICAVPGQTILVYGNGHPGVQPYDASANHNICGPFLVNNSSNSQTVDFMAVPTNSISAFADPIAGCAAIALASPALLKRVVIPKGGSIALSPMNIAANLALGVGIYYVAKSFDALWAEYPLTNGISHSTAPTNDADCWHFPDVNPFGAVTAKTAEELAADAAKAALQAQIDLAAQTVSNLLNLAVSNAPAGASNSSKYVIPDTSAADASLTAMAGNMSSVASNHGWAFTADATWWRFQPWLCVGKTNVISLYPPEAIPGIWDWRVWLKAILGAILAYTVFATANRDFWLAVAGGFSGAGVQIPNMQAEVLGSGGNVLGIVFGSVSAASVVVSIISLVALAAALAMIFTQIAFTTVFAAPPSWFTQIGWFLTEIVPLQLGLFLLWARVMLWAAGALLFKKFVVQSVLPR